MVILQQPAYKTGKEKKRKIELKSFFRELEYQRKRTVPGEEFACCEKFQWHCQLPALWCMLRNSNLQGKKKLKSGTG
jgi:hypothetical protein